MRNFPKMDSVTVREGFIQWLPTALVVVCLTTKHAPAMIDNFDVQVAVSYLARLVYLSTLHPLAKYPGPKLAAVSNLWYAYHW